jgi:hypothetical protein
MAELYLTDHNMRNYEKSLLKYQIERLAILKKMKPIKDSLLPYQKRLKQV